MAADCRSPIETSSPRRITHNDSTRENPFEPTPDVPCQIPVATPSPSHLHPSQLCAQLPRTPTSLRQQLGANRPSELINQSSSETLYEIRTPKKPFLQQLLDVKNSQNYGLITPETSKPPTAPPLLPHVHRPRRATLPYYGQKHDSHAFVLQNIPRGFPSTKDSSSSSLPTHAVSKKRKFIELENDDVFTDGEEEEIVWQGPSSPSPAKERARIMEKTGLVEYYQVEDLLDLWRKKSISTKFNDSGVLRELSLPMSMPLPFQHASLDQCKHSNLHFESAPPSSETMERSMSASSLQDCVSALFPKTPTDTSLQDFFAEKGEAM
ncbi:uncharacterized protein VTP21DRAFT_10071 [Calcarisporiella thermophila]|uniref:uncharacterized protein n=1 Tax=Calcarisporiella thermophila TaxID=911321 RepID=UPI0037448CB5